MNTASPEMKTRLEVAKPEFIEELKRLTKVLGRRSAGDALLRYEDGKLRISIGGAEVGMAAHGQWQGEGRVSAAWIRAFVKVPPAQDPVVFEVQGGRMRVGGSSIPCRWQVPGAPTIEVALSMGLRDRLRLGFAHAEAELEKSGLAPTVADARTELEERIAAAAKQLAPLGITPTDARLLVVGKLQLDE